MTNAQTKAEQLCREANPELMELEEEYYVLKKVKRVSTHAGTPTETVHNNCRVISYPSGGVHSEEIEVKIPVEIIDNLLNKHYEN